MAESAAAIIPLGRRSLDGSMRPTRGSLKPFQSTTGGLSGSSTGRAGPPLLFGLAPRGVFHAPDVATRAVSSYLTVSPLPVRTAIRDQPKVLPPTGHRDAFLTGGLVSVALSVARPFPATLPGVTRRVALPYSNGGVRTFLQPIRFAALDQRSPVPPASIIINMAARDGNEPVQPGDRIARKPLRA
jgi:hypothetical protein